MGFFLNYLSRILLAEPSNSHQPTFNQIEPVHLLLSHHTTPLIPSPPAHSPRRRWHTKCNYEICKAHYLPNKLVIKSLFMISYVDLVVSNMLYIDIFMTEIYIVMSESFINLIRLL
jgi:hypothetical protein